MTQITDLGGLCGEPETPRRNRTTREQRRQVDGVVDTSSASDRLA
jgi:hypothetical protein